MRERDARVETRRELPRGARARGSVNGSENEHAAQRETHGSCDGTRVAPVDERDPHGNRENYRRNGSTILTDAPSLIDPRVCCALRR